MQTPRLGTRLVIDRIAKNYGHVRALNEISLEVNPGEMLALLGPSGCGKTTLLKIIAGLHDPSSGRILVEDNDVIGLPTHRRGMGMLFQNYALFPHLDVQSNVAFGLEMRHTPRAEIRQRVAAALERVKLQEFGSRMPRELSGGQQQRVALARAIVYEPTVLLLDEPLAALDKNLREGMQMELRGLCRDLGLTTVLVTHDQEEAMTMADRIAVMRDGWIEQIDRVRKIYDEPANRFVAGFIGTSNFLEFTPGVAVGNLLSGTAPEGNTLETAKSEKMPEAGQAVVIAVRPEHMVLEPGHAIDAPNCLNGTLSQLVFRGSQMTAVLTTAAGREIIATAPAASITAGLAEGQPAHVRWRAEHALLLADH